MGVGVVNLAAVKAGDIVEIDHKGRRFWAQVRGVGDGRVNLRPLDQRISWREAGAREVIGIWHANKATTARYTAAP